MTGTAGVSQRESNPAERGQGGSGAVPWQDMSFLSFLVIFCQSQVPPLQPGNFSELPGDVKMFYSSPVSRLALAFLLVLI